jgi:hypothetical protein
MAIDSVTNFARSTVNSGAMTAGSPANGATFTVVDGSAFPASNFYVVIDLEIILISSRSTNTFTVHATTGRGQRGTSAASHSNGAQVFNGPLAHHVSESAYTTQANVFTQATTFQADVDMDDFDINDLGQIRFGTGVTAPSFAYIDQGNLTGGKTRTISSPDILYGYVGEPVNNGNGIIYGYKVTPQTNFAGTVASLVGINGQVRLLNAASVVSDAYGVLCSPPIMQAGSAITRAYGVYVNAQTHASITNGYGVVIESAKTVALWLGAEAAGTTATGGISWGSGRDVNLFRSAANTLNVTATGTPVLQVGGSTVLTAATGAALASANTFTTAQVIDVASDVVPITLIGHSSQTAAYLIARNDANTRTYVTFDPEIIHNQFAFSFTGYDTGVTSGFALGIRSELIIDPAGASATVHIAGNSWATVPTTNTQNFTSDMVGHIGQVSYGSSGTHSGLMVGSKGAIDHSAAHGAVTTQYGVLATVDDISAGTTSVLFKGMTPARAGTATNFYGMWIDPITKGGTQSIGVRIDTPTGAGAKYALWVGADAVGTTTASGIAFGSAQDVTLARQAPLFTELATNVIFSASGSLVKIGAVGPALEAAINLNGSTIYRDGALSLRTASSINADAGIEDNGVLVTKQVPLMFSKGGTLTVGAGTHRAYIDGGNWTIISIRASVGTAPTGASLIVDVNKNGTTVHTTQSNRATIAASGFTDLADSVQVSSVTTGDYLTVDIDQVGSGVAGSDLTVTIWLQRA